MNSGDSRELRALWSRPGSVGFRLDGYISAPRQRLTLWAAPTQPAPAGSRRPMAAATAGRRRYQARRPYTAPLKSRRQAADRLGDVVRRVRVDVLGFFAARTEEPAAGRPFRRRSAPTAGSAGPLPVDVLDFDAGQDGLVRDEPLELVEGPIMQASAMILALFFALFSGPADPGQVFQPDAGDAVSDGEVHDRPADLVVHIRHPAVLAVAESLERAVSAGFLELTPQFRKAPPDVGQRAAVDEESPAGGASDQQADQTQVDAHSLFGPGLRVFDRDGDREMDVPLTPLFHQIGCALLGLPGQELI